MRVALLGAALFWGAAWTAGCVPTFDNSGCFSGADCPTGFTCYNINGVADTSKNINYWGKQDGWTERYALNGNLSLSQVLSRLTVFDASYGATYQSGSLDTSWSSAPASRRRCGCRAIRWKPPAKS